MTKLPQDIKERFFDTIKGDITPDAFEQWLYSDKELENHLSPDDYLDLVSFNFKGSGAKYELSNLLKKHIDPGEFETYKMLGLLYEAKLKNDRLPYILREFYDLYCKGYGFLQDLGLGIGMALEVPRVDNSAADTWEELTTKQQRELLDSFSPDLEECLDQAICWLETRKIIPTGEQTDIGYWKYEDLRTEAERKSRFWKSNS